TDTPDPVVAGNNLTYTIMLTNNGPDRKRDVNVIDTLPANTTFVLFAAPVGWTTTTPAAGSAGTVAASLASLDSGLPATFTLVVKVAPGVAGGTTISDTASATTATNDPFSGDNAATATTTVNAAPVAMADVAVGITDGPDPVVAGNNLTYTITVTNNGPDAAQNVSLIDTLPANTTFVLFAAPLGWTTTTPAAGSSGTVAASLASLDSGLPATFTLVVNVAAGVAGGTTISNTASATAATNDPFSGD